MEIAAKHPRPSISAQPTLIEAITRGQPYKNDSNKKKELDALVVRMIVEDLKPLSVAEDKGVQEISKWTQPRYELASQLLFTTER